MKIQSLAIVLRIMAVILLCAVFAVVMPMKTMDQIHRWLGLGPMPKGPIVEYLARSLSLFYALTGAILWYISRNIRKYLDFFRFYLIVSYPFALALFLIDLHAGLPIYWIAIEGPFVMAFITLLLVLHNRIRRDLA